MTSNIFWNAIPLNRFTCGPYKLYKSSNYLFGGHDNQTRKPIFVGMSLYLPIQNQLTIKYDNIVPFMIDDVGINVINKLTCVYTGCIKVKQFMNGMTACVTIPEYL